MRFTNTILVTLAIVAASVLARPVDEANPALPGRPKIPLSKVGAPDSDILQTVDDDIDILTTALSKSKSTIDKLLKSPGASAAINVQVNANMKAIVAAATQAAGGVAGDLADAANTLTAPEARLLKADAMLVQSLATNTAELLKKVAGAAVSATNAELAAEKAAVSSAVASIIQPLQSYVAGVEALAGSGAEAEVADLKKTVAGVAASIKTVLA